MSAATGGRKAAFAGCAGIGLFAFGLLVVSCGLAAIPHWLPAAIGVVGIVVAINLVVLGWFPWALVLMRLRLVRSARQAAALLSDLEPAVDVTCPQCGAHSAVVGGSTWPCPYCESPLVPPASVDIGGQLERLASAHAESHLLDYLASSFGDPRAPFDVHGWTYDLVDLTGDVDGRPLRGGLDASGSWAVHVVQFDSEGPQEPTWWVDARYERALLDWCSACGVPIPPERHELSKGWCCFGARREVPAGLKPGEALGVASTGLTWVRIDPPLAVAWRSWGAHVPRLQRYLPGWVSGALGR